MPTVEAQITGLSEKTAGWWRIEIDRRPNWFDTKREDLVEEARRLLREGSTNLLQYNERDSRNINPNTNEPYKDRFYEGMLAAGGNGREPERRQAKTGDRGFGWRTNPVDAWRMTLGMAAKLAVDTLPLLPVEQRDPESQWTLMKWWANRIWFEPMPPDNPLDEQPPPSDEFGF